MKYICLLVSLRKQRQKNQWFAGQQHCCLYELLYKYNTMIINMYELQRTEAVCCILNAVQFLQRNIIDIKCIFFLSTVLIANCPPALGSLQQ